MHAHLSMIGVSVKVEKIAIEKLVFDPNNARKHDNKNLDAIKGSLTKFGLQKPIVIDDKNIIIAGNGTAMAAKALGWSEIVAVRTDLKDPILKTAFALADNKTSDLSFFDDDVLKETLASLQLNDFEIGEIGFDVGDLGGIDQEKEPEKEVPFPGDEFLVVVTCRDELQQREIFERLSEEGVSCKIMS